MRTRNPDRLMGPAVVVRAATEADATAAALVWQAGWLDGHRGHVPDELLAARGPEYFAERAAALTTSTVLATEPDGAIVGLVIVSGDELVQLAVDPSGRRRGAGAALLHAAESRIAAAHLSAWLAVVPGNERARTFYERHGWTDAGRLTYPAPTADDPIAVTVRRYTKHVASTARSAR